MYLHFLVFWDVLLALHFPVYVYINIFISVFSFHISFLHFCIITQSGGGGETVLG